MRFIKDLAVLLIFTALFQSCGEEIKVDKEKPAKNVIIVVMDGARYSETWGEPTRQYIPKMAGEMSKTGVYLTHFYNNGSTTTTAGHISITTGVSQKINNSGKEKPQFPSIFQYWNSKYEHRSTDSWIISSKDKLEVLATCKDPIWMNLYSPSTDCGISGLGSGYRNDSITFNVVNEILSEYHPKLVLINFREPDYSAHLSDWNAYLKGITKTDEYISRIWKFIQSDSIYKDNTDIFVTNDHGRHLDSIADGFISHGDTCEGCRHISLFAFGPDIKSGIVVDSDRNLLDLSATIAYILGIRMREGQGEVMYEIFR